MKKILLSIAFIAGFAAWTIHMSQSSAVADGLSLTVPTTTGTTSRGRSSSSSAVAIQPPKQTLAAKSPTPSHALQRSGKYTNGTYAGSITDAYYGPLQVQAVITNGQLSDVQFLQYPNDRSTSRQISAYALPRLRQEAIQSQSANVSIISGATDVSGAFRQSLADALSQALPA